MKRVTAFILAGGEGRGLTPLTDFDAKPAIQFGGGFRLIDFTLMNCARAGVPRAVALVQHQPDGLLSYLRNPTREVVGQLNLRAVQPEHDEQYLGTADAVRKNLRFADWTVDQVLIVPGDQVYRMDYARMVEQHVASGADITVAVTELEREQASAHGVVEVDSSGRLLAFDEQPVDPPPLAGDPERCRIALGVYVFNREVLNHLLLPTSGPAPVDFGRDVLPHAVHSHKVFAYNPAQEVPGAGWWWRDVGTLHQLWSANLEFLGQWNRLLHEAGGPVLPRGIVYVENGFDGRVVNALVPANLELADGEIRDSVLAANVQIKGRVRIVESIIQGGVVIEDGCEVRKAILDREVRLTGEARVDPRRSRPGSQIRTVAGLTVVPRGVLVRGPAKIPRPCASMPRDERRAGFLG